MAIGNAVQRGNSVYVFNEKNLSLFTASGELMGYTSSLVNIKRENTIYSYNEKGQIKNATHV